MVAQEFVVEPGHVLRFKRSIGFDVDKVGSDDVVPPTFTLASVDNDPEWWLRPHPGRPWWGSGAAAGEPGTGRGLHAEQHFTYERPVRVGDVLHGNVRAGATWDKQGRSGPLHFLEEITEWRDSSGALVVTERRVRAITERPPVAKESQPLTQES